MKPTTIPWDLLSLISAASAIALIFWMLGSGLLTPAALLALALVMVAVLCLLPPPTAQDPSPSKSPQDPRGCAAQPQSPG